MRKRRVARTPEFCAAAPAGVAPGPQSTCVSQSTRRRGTLWIAHWLQASSSALVREGSGLRQLQMRSLPDGGSADGAAWKRECKLKYRHTASDRQSSCSGPGTRASVRMRTSWLNLEQSQLAPRGREDMADALAASTPPVPRSPTQAPSVPAPPAVDALPTTTTTTAAPSTSVPSPSPAPSATPVPLPDNPFDNPASEAARAALQASRWNGLLRWGRAARLGGHGGAPAGWDFATGMWVSHSLDSSVYATTCAPVRASGLAPPP